MTYFLHFFPFRVLCLGFSFKNGQIASGEKVPWLEGPESLIEGSEIGTFSIEASTAALSHLHFNNWIIKQVASSICPLLNNK